MFGLCRICDRHAAHTCRAVVSGRCERKSHHSLGDLHRKHADLEIQVRWFRCAVSRNLALFDLIFTAESAPVRAGYAMVHSAIGFFLCSHHAATALGERQGPKSMGVAMRCLSRPMRAILAIYLLSVPSERARSRLWVRFGLRGHCCW